MNSYIGRDEQIFGIEEHRLIGGKGDGMRLYEVTNGMGLEAVVSPDRNGDITRLRCFGINLSYYSPCGYVAPAYYVGRGTGWLKSFTAGFLTTCGLESVGGPCVDAGEELPLHGSIANIPFSYSGFYSTGNELVIETETHDEEIFGRKLRLNRRLIFSTEQNQFKIIDTITNTGDKREPFEILYHMNMGYPLLDENSVINIPSAKVIARDKHAEDDIDNWNVIEQPTAGYREKCYYHSFEGGKGYASIYQPACDIELSISYDAKALDAFVEWKMMGIRDYVLGLECGNCYPDGRDKMRNTGMLKYLEPGEEKDYSITVSIRRRTQ